MLDLIIRSREKLERPVTLSGGFRHLRRLKGVTARQPPFLFLEVRKMSLKTYHGEHIDGSTDERVETAYLASNLHDAMARMHKKTYAIFVLKNGRRKYIWKADS